MPIFTVKRILIAASLAMFITTVPPAYAIFAKLSTNLLAAVTINGITPTGNASIDQSGYPTKAGILSIKVSKVNLPDGSILSVNLSDCPWYGAVAFIKIFGGSANISTSLPATCQIGRLSSVTVGYKTAILLKGGSPWKI